METNLSKQSAVEKIFFSYSHSFLFILIPGSPYKFHVDSISSGYVTAYGPGLLNGVSGEPSEFTISTKGAGSGGLSMAVEGPSKAEVRIFLLSSFIVDWFCLGHFSNWFEIFLVYFLR